MVLWVFVVAVGVVVFGGIDGAVKCAWRADGLVAGCGWYRGVGEWVGEGLGGDGGDRVKVEGQGRGEVLSVNQG